MNLWFILFACSSVGSSIFSVVNSLQFSNLSLVNAVVILVDGVISIVCNET